MGSTLAHIPSRILSMSSARVPPSVANVRLCLHGRRRPQKLRPPGTTTHVRVMTGLPEAITPSAVPFRCHALTHGG